MLLDRALDRRDPGAVKSVVEVARQLRREAKQTRPPFSTHKIVETAFPDAVVSGRPLPPGVLELVSMTANGPVIIYARHLPVPQQRFVIAHALAHLLFDGTNAFIRQGERRNMAVEDRADWFAEELLAPVSRLRRCVRVYPTDNAKCVHVYLDHVDEIASRFVVPSAVIDKRIRSMVKRVRRYA